MPNHVDLPIALASGLVLDGMTAPAMRMALALISTAGRSGGIDMLKPELERLAGVRLDNADRSLDRLRHATAGDDPVFGELEYTPGVQKRLAGVIRGRVSPGLLAELSHPRHGGKSVKIDVDELRACSSVPGILLLLRLAVERQREVDRVQLRLRDVDALEIFGAYIDRAGRTRSKANGEQERSTSLSRIYAELIEPAIRDLWPALQGWTIDAVPGVPAAHSRGKAWSHIDVTMSRLQKRPSIKELAAMEKDRAAYQLRKHDTLGSS